MTKLKMDSSIKNWRAEWDDSGWWTILSEYESGEIKIWQCIEGEEDDIKAEQIADANGYLQCIEDLRTWNGSNKDIEDTISRRLKTLENGLLGRAKALLI